MNALRNTLLRTVLLIGAFVVMVAPVRGEVSGSFNLGTGYLAHPIGISDETETGYLYQMLRLSVGSIKGDNAFKLGYEGQASQFGKDTQLGSQRHGLGVEWFHNSADRRTVLSGGIQGAVRRHEDWYQAYDHDEGFAYLAFKKFVGSRTLWKGFAGLRLRKYDDLPEESYREPHGELEVQRFSENRTTLGLKVRYGWKQFNDDVASQVWETLKLPSTSQLAARLSFSKGLSERTGLRTWAEYRWKLSEFPYYVADDVYDSPVLDHYATEGYDLLVALKTLVPWQFWFEAGSSLGEYDYGEIQFPTTDGAGEGRNDTVWEIFGSLQRTFGKDLGRPKLSLMGGWRDQDSNLDWYRYSGVFFSTNLAWKF